MPVIHLLKKHKTRVFPLEPIMKNESTTSNNIQIIENIFAQQFGMQSNDPIFTHGMRLVSGDLKTWSRIRSAKDLRAGTARDSFDGFSWVLPTIGLWHLRFNMLQLLHRIHWGAVKPASPSTLQWAADRWARSNVAQAASFQELEELIIHSYQARVLGVWIRCVRAEKCGTDRFTDTQPWLNAQTERSWLGTLRRISNALATPQTTAGHESRLPITDEEFYNHQVFCSHVEIYLTLRHAIKYADIGLLRYSLRQCAVIFQSKEASTPMYGRALLYTLHLVDSPASDPQLQDFILANSLVNLRGAADSNFELDRLLELLNNSLKIF